MAGSARRNAAKISRWHLHWRDYTSPEDWEKGFGDGELGWDAPDNIGITVFALLYDQGDFSQTICIAVNCGEDTDCTAATAGALFGILHGAAGIPENWIAPIGRKIKTGCLNLGELGFYGNLLPADVDNLTTRTVEVARQMQARFRPNVKLTSDATDFSAYAPKSLLAADAHHLYNRLQGPVYRFDFFEIYLDCGGQSTISPGQTRSVRVKINNTYKVQANLRLKWYLPDGWQVTPRRAAILSFPDYLGATPDCTFEFTAPAELGEAPAHRFVLEVTASDGRPLVMTAPLVFLSV